jgi:hypothetical protein
VNIKFHCEAGSETGYHAHIKALAKMKRNIYFDGQLIDRYANIHTNTGGEII